jgi:hypothetical protein
MLQQERLTEERIPYKETRRARDSANKRQACAVLMREARLAFGTSAVTGFFVPER